MPVRRHGPVVAAPRYSNYSNVRHDYAIDDSIHRADYLSNAVLEDTYEAATRSRGKDNELLRSVNAAIVSTEQHISPRAATVSRRVRASTAPPVSRPLPGQQVQQHQHIQGESPWSVRARAGSVPPPDLRGLRGVSLPPRPRKPVAPAYHAPEPIPSTKLWAHAPVRADFRRSARATSVEPQRRHSMYDSPYRDPLPSSTLWAHRPRVLRSDASLLARARAENRRSYPGVLTRAASEPRVFERASDYYYSIPEVKERALSRYLYAHRGKYGPETKPPRPSLGNFPQVYVPWNGPGPSNRSKAAIIGSRMEADGPKRQRRPRSEFAANKLRELKRDELERKYNF